MKVRQAKKIHHSVFGGKIPNSHYRKGVWKKVYRRLAINRRRIGRRCRRITKGKLACNHYSYKCIALMDNRQIRSCPMRCPDYFCSRDTQTNNL